MEVFYTLLVSSGRYTFLPELYDIFGREATIKFLEVFAGCRISVPSLDRLEHIARDTSVYVRLKQAKGKAFPTIVDRIADEYNICEDRVRSIYDDVSERLEEDLGIMLVGEKKRV